MSDAGEVPPPENPPPTPKWAKDDRARNEERWFDKEDKLKGIEWDNRIWWMTILGWIVGVLMILVGIIFMVGVVVLTVHITGIFRWLSPDDVHQLKSMVFSGTIGALLSAFGQKHFGHLVKSDR